MKHETASPVPSPEDFRIFLQSELARRCQGNPRYSIRAFARFLGVSASFLSHLLRGRRGVTRRTIVAFGKKLGLSPDTIGAFNEFHFSAPVAAARPLAFQQLTIDQFQMISDWYHYAILELLNIPGLATDARAVVRALGISAAEANSALERLERLEMIEASPQGGWINVSGEHTTVGNEFTASAFRNLQRQILTQAIDALEDVPFDRRDQSSLTLSLDSRLLPEFKALAKDFRSKVNELQARSPAHDDVYHLSVSLYPVLKKRKIAP